MDENNNIVCDEVKWIGYVGKENMISNAIAEILKLIQFEDIRVYNNIISKIIGDESFEQSRIEVQRKANSKDKSIPDILIKQNSYCILFEAKRGDENSINSDQLERHCKSLDGTAENKILIYLLKEFSDERIKEYKEIVKGYNKSIKLNFITYQDILNEIREHNFSNTLQQLVNELEYYLDKEDFLKSWKNRLDIVNCSKSIEDIKEKGYYACTLNGSNYNHKKSKIFMAYNNKQIEFIANIEAVINYDENGKENRIYCMKKVNKKYQFGEIIEKEDRQNIDLKFFILSDITPIENCKKSSSNGMYGNKMYIETKKECNIEDLQNIINDISWENREDLEKQINEKLK